MASQNVLEITLKGYREETERLTASLLNLEKGSKEYSEVLDQIRQRQEKYNQVLGDTRKQSDSNANTIIGLKQKLKELEKEWKTLEVGSKRFKELSAEIKSTRGLIGQLEQDTGNFTRNVGNYAGGFIQAFSAMGMNVSSLQAAFSVATQGAAGFNTALSALAAHPFIAAALVLVGILIKVKDAIADNEELSNRWSEAMAVFEPVINGVKIVLDGLANGLVVLLEGISQAIVWVDNINKKFNEWCETLGFAGKVLQKVTDVLIPGKAALDLYDKAQKASNTTVQESINLKKQENQLNEDKRRVQIENSEIEIRMAKREVEIAKARKHNAKEYHRLMEEQKKDQKKIIDNNIGIAKTELEIAKLRAAQAPNDKKTNDELAEREAALNKLIAEQSSSLAALIKQDERVTETKTKVKTAAELQREAEEALLKVMQKEITLMDLRHKKLEQDVQINNLKEEAAGFNTLFDSYDREQALLEIRKKNINEAIELQKKYLNDEKIGAEKRFEIQTQIDQLILEREKINGEIRINIVKKTTNENLKAYDEAANKALQTYIETTNAMNLAFDTLALDLSKKDLRILPKMDGENFAEFKEQIDTLGTVISPEIDKIKEKYNLEEPLDQMTKQLTEKLAEMDEANVSGWKGFWLNEDKAREERQTIEDERYLVSLELEKQKINEYYDEIIGQMESTRAKLKPGTDEYALMSENIAKAQMERDNKVAQNSIKQMEIIQKARKKDNKSAKEWLKENQKNISQSANAMGSLFGAIGDFMEQDIQSKLEHGEITKEEAEKEYENVQKVKIAEATIGMFEGITQAVATAYQLGPIAGPIVGAANAATVLTTGVMNIKKIKETNPYKETGAESASSTIPKTDPRNVANVDFSGVSVNPILNEDEDLAGLQSLNVQGNSQGSQQVYILQSDIDASQKQVQVRESQTHF